MAKRRHAKKALAVASASRSLPVGLLLGTLLTTSLLIRLLASRGDLWLDEILSVELVRNLTRPWDVVFATEAQVDNNHVLNTSWLYLFRYWSYPVVQRLHSAIAGTISVASAY